MIFFSCHKPALKPIHHVLLLVKEFKTVSKKENTIIPYETNLMALELVRRIQSGEPDALTRQSYLKICRNYIRWYLNHVNHADKYGLSGTIYNHDILADGSERSSIHYDSADNTAATFILLVHRFYRVSGYKTLIEQNRKHFEAIVYVIPHQKGEDGLCRAMPIGKRRYLANNCECLAALAAFAELSGELGWEKEDYYRTEYNGLKEAIMEQMYRPRLNEFYRLIDEKGKYTANWNALAPGSIEQLFPVLYGLPTDEKNRRRLFRAFDGMNREKIKQMTVVQNLIYKWARATVTQAPRESTGISVK